MVQRMIGVILAAVVAVQSVSAQSTRYLAGSNAIGRFAGNGWCDPPDQHIPGVMKGTPQSATTSAVAQCDAASIASHASAFSKNGSIGTHVSVSAIGAAHCSFGPCSIDASGAVDATAYLHEAFNVTSPTLAYATPVTLLFTAVQRGTGISPTTANSTTYSSSTFTLGYGNLYFAFAPGDAAVQTQSIVINTFVGAQVSIDMSLYSAINALARAGHTDIADVDVTESVYVDATSPDVTLTSDSGYDYSTPTVAPEPSTFILLVSGLSVLGVMARRRGTKPFSDVVNRNGPTSTSLRPK